MSKNITEFDTKEELDSSFNNAVNELLGLSSLAPISTMSKRDILDEWRLYRAATGDEISLREFKNNIL